MVDVRKNDYDGKKPRSGIHPQGTDSEARRGARIKERRACASLTMAVDLLYSGQLEFVKEQRFFCCEAVDRRWFCSLKSLLKLLRNQSFDKNFKLASFLEKKIDIYDSNAII